jgi:putative aldouronate transport system permease protein
MTAIGYWNDWQNALYYLDSPKLNSIQQVLRMMDSNMSYLANIGGGGVARALPVTTIRMAIAVVVALPLIGVYPFFHKYFKKGITLGATKE